MRVARPLSKGWPPPGQDEEGDDKERTLKDRELDFDIRQIQQVLVQPGSLDGQLVMEHDLNCVKYRH